MKFILASCVFILAFSINIKVVASESEVCTAEKTEHCSDTKANAKHESAVEAKGEKLSERMNSLYPEKQKNPEQIGIPSIVKLTSPKFMTKIAGNSAKLEWTAVEGATNYHVQVATDPNFKWLVTNDQWVKSNSFDATSLEENKKYYWRVASVKSQNDSMFTKSVFVSSAFSTK